MAATDVKQVAINFSGQGYFDSFPKLEKRGRIPKRVKATAAAEEHQVLVEDLCRESTDVEEKTHKTAAVDQEERETLTPHEEPQKSDDEEREMLEDVGFDEHHKSDEELDQEENDWVVSATKDIVENPQKSNHDGATEEISAEERETSSAVEEKTQRTAVADQEETREIQEKEFEDAGFDKQHKSDEAPPKSDQGEKDCIVSATQDSAENIQKSIHDGATEENPAEERETATNGDDDYLFFGTFRTLIPRPKISSESAAGYQVINEEEREAPVDEEREIIQEKKMEEDVGVDDQEQQKSDDGESNQEEKEGVVSQLEDIVENPQKPTTDPVEQARAEGKETSEESTHEREVVAGGERENQDMAVGALIREEETQLVQKIVVEKEAINFGGKNYEDHFPKIERKQRITKRERRGEFQN